MASKSSSTPAPLTFDLEQSLVEKIENTRDSLGFQSTSEVVRHAISKFNFDRYKPEAADHRQISVRLPGDMRSLLKKQSRAKSASIGELLRVAIESLEANAKAAPAKKPAAKKAAKKPAAKKKAARKPAAKKPAAMPAAPVAPAL